MSSRGDTATLSGGPTTLLGTSISASTFGGLARRSMIDTVSGWASFCTTTLPSTNFTLASLADTAICATAVPAAAIDNATASAAASPAPRHISASPNRCGESLASHRQAGHGPLPAVHGRVAHGDDHAVRPCYELL